jgi:hypothetical protein
MNTLSPFSILKVLSMSLSCKVEFIKLTLHGTITRASRCHSYIYDFRYQERPIFTRRALVYTRFVHLNLKKRRRHESVRSKFHCLTQRKSLLVKPPATRDLCPSLMLFLLPSRTTKVCPRPIELRNKAEHGDACSNGGTPCPSHVQQSHGSRHLKYQPERHKRKFNRLKPNGNYMYQPL